MGTQIKAKGGGWYFLEDGSSLQLSKAKIKEGGYEVVDSFGAQSGAGKGEDPGSGDSGAVSSTGSSGDGNGGPAPDLGASAAAPPPPPGDFGDIDDGSNVPEDTGEVVTELQPPPGTTLPIGPYSGYAYVDTPYGEFGVPAGYKIVAFKQVRDFEGKLSYRAVYEGRPIARTPEQRLTWLAEKEAERAAQSDSGIS